MRRTTAAMIAACFTVTLAVACSGGDDSTDENRVSTSTRARKQSTPTTPTTAATPPPTTAPPTTAAARPGSAPEVCGELPEWLGPSTSAVVRRIEGSTPCAEVLSVARDFFFDPAVPVAATVRDWQCSRDAEGIDHVGDCAGPEGRITVDVGRPGEG